MRPLPTHSAESRRLCVTCLFDLSLLPTSDFMIFVSIPLLLWSVLWLIGHPAGPFARRACLAANHDVPAIEPGPLVRQGICRSWIVLGLAALGPAGCKSTLDDVSIKDVYGPAGRHAKNLVEQANRDAKGGPQVGL